MYLTTHPEIWIVEYRNGGNTELEAIDSSPYSFSKPFGLNISTRHPFTNLKL